MTNEQMINNVLNKLSHDVYYVQICDDKYTKIFADYDVVTTIIIYDTYFNKFFINVIFDDDFEIDFDDVEIINHTFTKSFSNVFDFVQFCKTHMIYNFDE